MNNLKNKELSFLHTNGLASFISSSLNLLNTRSEHSSYMVTIDNPSTRLNIISSFIEILKIDGKEYYLANKEFVDSKKNYYNDYLVSMTSDIYPEFTYLVKDIKLVKRLCYKHETNNLELEYEITNNSNYDVKLDIIPLYRFTYKGDDKTLEVTKDKFFKLALCNVYYKTSLVEKDVNSRLDDVYFELDKRDGRREKASDLIYHKFSTTINKGETKLSSIYYSLAKELVEEDYFSLEKKRINKLLANFPYQNNLTKRLYLSSLDYLAKRDNLTTLVAGYPFFNDWGRDTMISVIGTLILPHHFDKTKEVFDSFLKYLNQGLMPNMFPDKGASAIYNTVDASLLFFEALIVYYKESHDLAYITKVMPYLAEILKYYHDGTLYNIHMDKDYLLVEGNLLNQLTWMDVRVNDILPTPRHGKPVEINALWYNAIMVFQAFCYMTDYDNPYKDYPPLIRDSFNKKFFKDNYLLDYLDVDDVNSFHQYQIRSNMSLALSYTFKVVNKENALVVLETIKDKLLTSHGLRSLASDDVEFKECCKGDMVSRDLAYHQGTVWPWTTASFYLSYLEYHNYDSESLAYVKEEMKKYEKLLSTGCINHIAEIYDGLNPSIARGCFAQSWSDSEILRVLIELERREKDE